ncbi:unnamed protein product [Allacma fusca]|uniref:Uncharacterized protein n=1 Tax=Allacma fusca TaxID=39272 RepID=A0A8J2P6V6_9HEXA|nr:unnamed protein product [Allacma fusca]
MPSKATLSRFDLPSLTNLGCVLLFVSYTISTTSEPYLPKHTLIQFEEFPLAGLSPTIFLPVPLRGANERNVEQFQDNQEVLQNGFSINWLSKSPLMNITFPRGWIQLFSLKVNSEEVDHEPDLYSEEDFNSRSGSSHRRSRRLKRIKRNARPHSRAHKASANHEMYFLPPMSDTTGDRSLTPGDPAEDNVDPTIGHPPEPSSNIITTQDPGVKSRDNASKDNQVIKYRLTYSKRYQDILAGLKSSRDVKKTNSSIVIPTEIPPLTDTHPSLLQSTQETYVSNPYSPRPSVLGRGALAINSLTTSKNSENQSEIEKLAESAVDALFPKLFKSGVKGKEARVPAFAIFADNKISEEEDQGTNQNLADGNALEGNKIQGENAKMGRGGDLTSGKKVNFKTLGPKGSLKLFNQSVSGSPNETNSASPDGKTGRGVGAISGRGTKFVNNNDIDAISSTIASDDVSIETSTSASVKVNIDTSTIASANNNQASPTVPATTAATETSTVKQIQKEELKDHKPSRKRRPKMSSTTIEPEINSSAEISTKKIPAKHIISEDEKKQKRIRGRHLKGITHHRDHPDRPSTFDGKRSFVV